MLSVKLLEMVEDRTIKMCVRKHVRVYDMFMSSCGCECIIERVGEEVWRM